MKTHKYANQYIISKYCSCNLLQKWTSFDKKQVELQIRKPCRNNCEDITT